jgi:VIT1/CCC1 family predicted Fe2+/Mn2+ transporter
MGAQDNLTNVLGVVLGVTVGAGRTDLVALAGVAAAIAEAVSMGGVLYTSTRAELDLDAAPSAGRAPSSSASAPRLAPLFSGLVTASAALAGGLIPLVPFFVLPIDQAIVACAAISLAALFALGSAVGTIGGRGWWREGLRLVGVASLAAVASALVGVALRVG